MASLTPPWGKLCRHPISSAALLPGVLLLGTVAWNPPPTNTHSCLGIHLLLLLIAHLKSQATVERIMTEKLAEADDMTYCTTSSKTPLSCRMSNQRGRGIKKKRGEGANTDLKLW